MRFSGTKGLFKNVLVAGNDVPDGGTGGLYLEGTQAGLENCTVADNAWRGIYRAGGTVSVSNSIVWGNVDDIVGTVALGWSNIEDGDNDGTNGCISVDPLFVDTTYYHLLSRAGHYVGGYFDGGTWATATTNSPSIDAGNPESDYSLELEPNGKLVNMGVYGNTTVASKTWSKPGTLFTFW